ncbi:hypothetical protein MG3_05901 [Candida albicans P78048]|uniref:Uncharacterized protein n=1 Tax=Candida albicans P78048 TaxID=1094989 RepID=A0AB34PJ62_CANAX|nr:hypothetical protein MG3_05901 [Candida albicans P78048]
MVFYMMKDTLSVKLLPIINSNSINHHKRMPYTRKDSPLFTSKVITIWLLTTRSNSGTVKLMTMDYTRSMINLLVNNVSKLNSLF